MTDPDLIAKKLAERFAAHTLQLAIQNTLDVASQLNDVLQNRLSDLIDFVQAIRQRAR